MTKRLWIGRYLGIDLYLHWSFFVLLIGYALYGVSVGQQTLLEVASMLGLLLSMFGCVTLHEYGHAMAARFFGIGTRDITMLPIGGLARLERMPREPWQEIVVAIAGPAVNVVIFLAILAGLLATDFASSWDAAPIGFWETLLVVNLGLVVFNMLPAFPMDGGRVLRAVLALVLSYRRATFIASRIGMVMAVAIGLAGSYLSGNPVTLLVAAFVFWAAGMENRQVAVVESVSGVSVGDVMTTSFSVLPADASVAAASDFAVGALQTAWPVMDDGMLVGVVDLDRIAAALERGDDLRRLGEIARPVMPATPATPLSSVIMTSAESHPGIVPVVDVSAGLIGILDLAQVSQRVGLRQATRRIAARTAAPVLPSPDPGAPPRERELYF